MRRALLISLSLLFAICGYAQPTADFSASSLSGCAPLAVSFTDASTGSISTWSWNLGNGVTPGTQNAATTYTTPGNYNVTLTVTGPGGSSNKSVTIVVYDKPTISISANKSALCPGAGLQFSSTVLPNSPGTPTYVWDFDDGTSDIAANPPHTYYTSGSYTVKLTVTNGMGCANTAVMSSSITVYTPPHADFTSNPSTLTFCSAPQTVSFSNISTGFSPISANWDLGNGNTSTSYFPSTTYYNAGTYPVKLNITDGHGCKDSATYSVSLIVVQPQISKPASICPGDSIALLNITPGNNTSLWNFGGGDTAMSNPVVRAFPSSGSYTVTLTTTVGPCTKTITDTIKVSPKPQVSISMYPPVPCPTPTSVSFSANSTLGTSFAWHWASGGSATGQTVTKYYPATTRPDKDVDVVTVIATTAAGCRDSVSMDTIMLRDILVRINPGELKEVDSNIILAGCVPLTINFSTDLFSHLPPVLDPIHHPYPFMEYPIGPVSWSWDFGDNTTSNAATPVHTFQTTGDYLVRCVITTMYGCTDTGYQRVHVDVPVHPSFVAVSPTTICPRNWVAFLNTTAFPLPNTTYFWFTNGDAVVTHSVSDTARLRFDMVGKMSVTLISNHLGCRDSFKIDTFVTVHPPQSIFNDSVYCPPSTSVAFKNLSYMADSVRWIFGDGTTSSASNPIHAYPYGGRWKVNLITYNNTYGCTDTSVAVLPVNLRPAIAYSDTTICRDERVDFLPIYPNPGGPPDTFFYYEIGYKYRWYTDGVLTQLDTGIFFNHVYKSPGHFDVKLYYTTKSGCLDSVLKPGFVDVAKPAANLVASPTAGCLPANVVFTDNTIDIIGGPITLRNWAFGDGDTAWNGGATPSHIYTQKGRFSATLYVVDAFGCMDTILKPNYITIRRPTAAFSVFDTSVCVRQYINFTNSSTGSSNTLLYQWDFGDGSTASIKQPAHQYTTAGYYTVRLIVTDSTGCSDTLLKQNYIRAKAPHASFIPLDTLAICPPLVDSFINTSINAVKYEWDLGTGSTTVTVPNPTKTYINTGIYIVTLTATDIFGCTDTARRTLRVLGYNGAFSYTPITGCEPMLVQFSTSLHSVPQIIWDFSDGSIAITKGTDTSHVYTVPGSYMPKVIFSDTKGCYTPSIGLDSIRVDKLDADFSWTLPCSGTAFTLKDSSHAYRSLADNWEWRFNGIDSASGASVSYVPTSPGPLSVTLIASNSSGCRDTVTRIVTVHPLPAVVAPNDTALCPDDTLRLIAAGGSSYAWSWSPSASQFLGCNLCDTAYFRSGGVPLTTIYLSGKDSIGCINQDSMIVAIKIKTTSSVGPGGEICEGESFRLQASGGQSYTWLPSETIDSPYIASPLARPYTSTSYIVAVKEGSCLVDSQTVNVVVHPLPHFDAGDDKYIKLGTSVMLEPTQKGIHHIVWRADTTLSCLDCFQPLAGPYYTRTYYATAYTEYGCTVTDSVTVHLRCNGSLVFMPNTFTPNGDGLNDYFYPRGEGLDVLLSFRIFDRWGEMVFERTYVPLNDEHNGWDGTYKGKALPPDTYFYLVRSRCASGEQVIWKGDITLMR
jgi:gliding motility-associated-like protein